MPTTYRYPLSIQYERMANKCDSDLRAAARALAAAEPRAEREQIALRMERLKSDAKRFRQLAEEARARGE